MTTRRAMGAVLAACLIGAPGCSGEKVSDTGYVGTWVRGAEDRLQSTLAIVRDGERYRVRWSLTSADASWKVHCQWDGQCEEFRDGEKVATYSFSNSIDPQTGHLIVECNGRNLTGQGRDVHWIDEFILKRQGRRLAVTALQQDERTFEGAKRPKRTYTKTSDRVTDPPRATD